MKTTVLALALALVGLTSLSAAPLKGGFLLSADSTVSVTKMISVSRGRVSLVSDSRGTFRVNAAEITIDQSNLADQGVSVVTCRGVTSVSAGYTIPASRELTVEIDGQANIYVANSSRIIVTPAATPAAPAMQFSANLPRLDLRLRAANAAK